MNTQQAAVAIAVVALAGWATGQTCVNGTCQWGPAYQVATPIDVEPAPAPVFPVAPVAEFPAARIESEVATNCSGFQRSSYGYETSSCGGFATSTPRTQYTSIRERIRARRAARRSRWR